MPPTLSQLEAWDTEHLVNAAAYWTTTADQWEDTFTKMRNQAQSVGWEGDGGEALRTRTSGDLSTVTPKTDQLRNAARIARAAASNISAAQRRALYAVQDAENEGFEVGEDLAVTDAYIWPTAEEEAARQAQAQAFAADINLRATQLLGAETDASGQLTAASREVGAMNFSPAPGGSPNSVGAPTNPAVTSPDDQIVNGPQPNQPHIRLVDANAPADPPSPTPQIGPFPVPPQVAQSAPPGPPRPVDPTGGLLTPQNLPPASPPPNIPGVKPVQPPAAPGPAPLPSYPDLVNQVNRQQQVLNNMQNSQVNVTPGGVLGSGLAGCASGAAVGALPTVVFPPADAVSVPGGCVVGAIGGLSSYLATIWGANAFGGN